jgi:hypothetical protein
MKDTTKFPYTMTVLIDTVLALGIISLVLTCVGVSILFWKLAPFFSGMTRNEIVMQERGEQRTDLPDMGQVAHAPPNNAGQVTILPPAVDKEPLPPGHRVQGYGRKYAPAKIRTAALELPDQPPQPTPEADDAEVSVDTAAVTFQTPEEAVQLLFEAQGADLDAETREILLHEYRLALRGL